MSRRQALATALSTRKTMVLTTFKRDGTPVDTPVSVAVAGERIFFRSYTKAWKVKRLRRNPSVEVTPSTLLGKPRGRRFRARARLLHAQADLAAAHSALARRQPVLQGLLVPLTHKLLGYTTVHYELEPAGR